MSPLSGLDDIRYLPDSNSLIESYRLRDRDLLFTRYNGSIELLGVCGMVRNLTAAPLLYPDKLMRVRFDHDLILPEYAEIFFQCPDARDRLMGRAKSSAGQQGISGKDIKEQPFAVPPLEEQREIAKRVDKLLSLVETTQTRAAAGKMQAEKLVQSTLAKAFRGELVPTEAEMAELEGREFETAQALLDRIRPQRSIEIHSRTRIAATSAVAPSASVPKPGMPVAARGARKGYSKGIFFKRAAIASYAVDRLHAKETFGRIQLEKLLYLCEAHIGLDLEGEYGRRAAGPLDPDIYKVESLARKHDWFEPRQRHGFGIEYRTGDKIADRCGAARTLLGKKVGEMDRLLTWFEKMTTEQAEVFATVFAAWNDFLLDRMQPTDEQIIEQVREHWHESKERFTPQRLRTCIAWMRQNRFIPRGVGPHTIVVAPPAPPTTRRRRRAA